MMTTSRKEFLKQSALLFCGSLLYREKVFAGSIATKRLAGNTYHPKTCSWNLKTDNLYNSSEIEVAYFTYSKPNPVHNDVMYEAEGLILDENGNPEYCGKPFFDACKDTDIFDTDPLRYKAYYPKSSAHDYLSVPLPVVVLFHGGAYAECSQFELPLMETFCQEFARKGFIAITCEYRRGILKDDNPLYTTTQQELALYRGQQDGRGAIRSIIKRNRVDQHGNQFLINEDQFFIGGASAGSVIALGCAYYRNQSMVNLVFPSRIGTPTIEQALGPVQADYYYGDLPDEINKYWPKIAGVMNCWGGISIPKSFDSHEYDFFSSANSDDNPPMISFQGASDNVFSYLDDNPQDLYFSSKPYQKENRCLLISPNYFYDKKTRYQDQVEVKVCSTLNMYCILKALNKYTEHYVDSDMGHGLDANSDFGINTSVYDVKLYLVHRAATFFQVRMNGAGTFGVTGRSYFKDCENYRVKCNPADNNACTGSENPCT